MKAIDITSTPPGGDRTPIADLVPLSTPLLLQIFPIYACNFKCKYCVFSTPLHARGFISDVIKLDLKLFQKCIDESLLFPDKVRVLRFVGMGEPLLHSDLPKMIEYASKTNKFERIEVLTNGSLLNREKSNQLINSGLTKLLISIQGTSAQKYKEVSGVNIDYEDFLNNIKYFYDHRGSTKLHIKIINCALENEKDREKFFLLFGDICDTIGIEEVGPIYPDVEYNKILEQTNHNQYGVQSSRLNICSQAFFSMQINPDGNVVPCYSISYPVIVGNCYEESLYDIWNGKKYNRFRLNMLNGIRCNEVCSKCDIFQHRCYKEDDLSGKIEELRQYYEE